MKKIISFILMLVLLSVSVFGLTLTNEQPVSGSVIVDGLTTFAVDTDVPAIIGNVYIENKSGIYKAYSLDCSSGTNCSTIVNIDSVNWAEFVNYGYYYVVDAQMFPVFPSTFQVSMDSLPSTPTGITVVGVTETSLNVDWSDNIESDFSHYNLFRDGVNIINVTNSEHLDLGLNTGQNYVYSIIAVDSIGQESSMSIGVNGTPMDMTPPTLLSVSPVSGSVVTSITPTIKLNYSENVTLKVYSGATLIQSLGYAQDFIWTPTFADNTTTVLSFNATDNALNYASDDYVITVQTSGTNLSVTVSETIHISVSPSVIKSNALSNGVDYVLLKYDISMNGGDFVRLKMSDLVGSAMSIQVNEDTQPLFFCGDDYDSGTMDIISSPTKNTYQVDNSYNESVVALDCTDTNPSGTTDYTVYLKVIIPSGVSSDNYNFNWDIGMYGTVI